jgi:hypothetical protein
MDRSKLLLEAVAWIGVWNVYCRRCKNQPGIRGEYNAVIKDRDTVDIRVALCFPDVYEIGMSNLACASSMV